MRILIALLLLLFVACSGCSQPVPEIERIEMRRSGWTGVDVEVNRQGEGRFTISETDPRGGSGSFSVTPEQFGRLRDRLEPFRRQAEPMTEESIERAINQGCPQGVPYVTDTGGFWIHWTGPAIDEHYWADLGCDPERNASRNGELRDIFYSLPIPLES